MHRGSTRYFQRPGCQPEIRLSFRRNQIEFRQKRSFRAIIAGRHMADADTKIVEALILALPDSAGSAIYGLVDVFASTGTLWRELVGDEPGRQLIRPKIVSTSREPFRCGNGIPV